MGLLTLANYNGDENDNENDNGDDNDNENDNENDLPWAMCFCALPFLCLSFQPATFGSAGDLWFSARCLRYCLLSPLNVSYPYLLFVS